MSATDFREADWSDADRLDVLGAPWAELRNTAAQRRYEAAACASLSPADARQVLSDPAATWLWRSLREAEAAGFDGPGTLRRAAESGSLADAESVAKVLDWRVRQHTAGMPARPAKPWSELPGTTGDPDTDRYWGELAQAMADRQRRLGEHAAEHPPAWAQALGPVPDHPLDRAGWEDKAAQVAAYREMWNHTDPHEPIGPKPSIHADPQARAMWQAAAQALGRQPGDLAGHTDGQLHAWRSAFAREMEWAPADHRHDLASVRTEIRRAQIDADRARRNAEAADTPEARQRLGQLAGIRASWERSVRDLAGRLEKAQAGYDAWEQATTPTRDRAVAADAELRRRHPGHRIEPLRGHTPPEPQPTAPPRPAEPAAATEPVSLRDELAKMGWLPPSPVAPSAPGRAEPAATAGPEPGPDTTPPAEKMARAEQGMADIRQRVRDISARLDNAAMQRARQAQEKAADITAMSVPATDPDAAPSPAWVDDLQARTRQAVSHDPLPRVPHAEALETAAETGASGPEAAD